MKATLYIIAICILTALSGTHAEAQTQKKKVSPQTSHMRIPSQKKLSTRVAPTWESINQRGYPQWFSDAKLGIFIHWGLYSVPSYASKEGYGEWLLKGLMTNDPGRTFIMKNFSPDTSNTFQTTALQHYAGLRNYWNSELWQPEEWAELFEASGAKYVLLVTKHHDGYCLWDYPATPLPNWNSVASGPRRNIVEELTRSVRRHNMKMGFYYSLTEWSNPLHQWSISPNDSIERYVEQHMIPQFKDLITKYKPSIIFTDGEWDNSAEQFHARELISWYYNTVGDEAIVNDRWGGGNQHGFKTPEYSGGIMDLNRPWAECRGLGRSFGLNRNEDLDNYLTSPELISHFVKLVAAGGGMTLNVGPSADGKIPLIQQERLRDLGRWLKTNGEAIYGSRPWSERCYQMGITEVKRTDQYIDFDWVRNSPDRAIEYDHFNATWEGTIIPPHTGLYTISIEVDDNAIVIIDNDTLIQYRKDAPSASESNAMDAHNYHATTAQISLMAGKQYHAKVIFEEKDIDARMRLHWSSEQQKDTPIPAVGGWRATYSCEKPEICFTTNNGILYAAFVNIQSDKLIINNMKNISSRTKITLLGHDGPITFSQKKGNLILSLDGIGLDEIMQSQGTLVFRIENYL